MHAFVPIVAFFAVVLCGVSGGVWAAQMTDADKIAVLNLHNSVRCSASSASGSDTPIYMPVMYWDTDLAAVAQNWIDTCPEADISNPPYSMGSNWAGGSGTSYTPLALAQLWADEKSLWTYNTAGTFATCSGDCGHYTQMVWANSLRVGCATNTNPCTSGMTYQLDCVYAPAGNFNNQVPYPISGQTTGSTLKNACSYTSMTTSFLTPYCSSPCQNGGTCVSFEYCKCPSGYAGNYCQRTYTSNSGLPSTYNGAFSCHQQSDCSAAGGGACCPSFLYWSQGQTCHNAYGTPSGWSGSCPAPSCSGANACQNGGTCVDTNICACPVGYSGAQCQTSSGTATTTAAPASTTTVPTTTKATTKGSTSTTVTTTTSTTSTSTSTTAHSVTGAVALQPFFDAACGSAYGPEIYVYPSPSCVTLGGGKAQVSVEASCAQPGNAKSAWSLQIWPGAECDGNAFVGLSGISNNMSSSTGSCPSVAVTGGPSQIAFKVDCGVGAMASSEITTGAAYPNAGVSNAVAANSQPLFAVIFSLVAAPLLILRLL